MLRIFIFSCIVTILFGCSSSDSEQDPTTIISVTDLMVSVPENLQSGYEIGTINASANTGNVSFAITAQTPPGAVSIDSNTGILTVANTNAFDFETNAVITGSVKVSQGALFETGAFTITLEDVYENVYLGDVVLTSQEEVNDFGANNFTEITGTLEINQYNLVGNITDLSPLQGIQKVGDRLRVITNNITSLHGLEDLQWVNAIHIEDNPYLEDISALEQITEVPLFVLVGSNPLIQSYDGLHNITSIGTELYLSDAVIENLDDFSNLSYLGKGFYLSDSPNLVNISALAQIQNELEVIQITSCPLLTSLDGLHNIGPNLTGLLYLHNNQSISDLSALSALNSVSNLTISNLPNLESLNGLQNVTTMTGKIDITDNDMLSDISALNNVTSFDLALLGIADNPLLQSLECFQNLSYVYDSVLIKNNGITNLQGLESLESVAVDMYVRDNVDLTDLCALTLLAQNNGVNGNFSIDGNAYNPTPEDIANGACSL